MIKDSRPNSLNNAPLQYAPDNELGVVYLFAHLARKLQLRVETIRPGFPDCIAYRRHGEGEKKVRIEFEFKSSNFKTHRHNVNGCDSIVCWQHDWPDCPTRIEIIELKKYYEAVPKVWIQAVTKKYWPEIDASDRTDWTLSKRTSIGDLLLIYRCYPETQIKDIFRLDGKLEKRPPGSRKHESYVGMVKRICRLKYPVFLEDFKNHNILKSAPFIKSNMQGRLQVTSYWPHIYQLIISRNRGIEKLLAKYAPDKL